MQTPPTLGVRTILDTTRRRYPSVRADRAVFLPRGDSSSVFLLGSVGSTSWVCKVYPSDDEDQLRAAVRSGTEVAAQLGSHRDGIRIPSILRAENGDQLVAAGDFLLQLQDHLPGEHVPLHLIGRTVLERLGRMLAALHSLPVNAPDRDHLHVPGAAVRAVLIDVDRRFPGLSAPAVLRSVRRLRDRAETAIAEADATTARTVPVHGDVVTTNVLLHDRTLALIDWDGIHRAPREYEFGTIAVDSPGALPAVLCGYRQETGVDLDGRLVVAHAARYTLFGLGFHLTRVLSDQDDTPQCRHDLYEARRYIRICQNWPRIEAAVLAATTMQECP